VSKNEPCDDCGEPAVGQANLAGIVIVVCEHHFTLLDRTGMYALTRWETK
jgi:hypothetical protein